MRSQNWCLTIPKLVPDYPKTGAWLSQNWCLTIVRHHFWDSFWDPKYDAWQLAVQKSTDELVATRESDLSSSEANCMLKLYWTAQIQFPSGHQLICTLLYSQSSGIIFGISETIPEMVPDNRQAPFLGPSGTSFGIVRHQFWDRQAPILGSHAYVWGAKRSRNGVTRVVSGYLKGF